MKVFYIDIEKARKTIGKEALNQFADIELKSDKRFWEYTLARYIVKTIGKEVYNIDDEIIVNKNGKPEFKHGGIYFSISHSKNLVAVCFDECPCGIDIEFMKERDLREVSIYYQKKFETIDDFYKFWTKNEAEYKLGKKTKYSYSRKSENYYLTVVSDNKINEIIFKKVI